VAPRSPITATQNFTCHFKARKNIASQLSTISPKGFRNLSSINIPAIEISGLTCTYKGQSAPALSSIELSLEMGSTVALLGPNGAGKSTLMKAIYGAIEASSGEVKIFGKKLNEHPEPYRVIGFTSDEPIYSAKAKVKGLFAFELAAQGLGRAPLDDLKNKFGLAGFWSKKLGKLSTGQRQRALIALATLSDPPILLLDEPANGLDIESLSWLYNLIKTRESEGKLTIVSSHNLAELQEIASRVVVIKQTLRHQGDFFPGVDSFESLRATYLQIVGGEN
jgi:ABC-2 type transport system ATP-binding protein